MPDGADGTGRTMGQVLRIVVRRPLVWAVAIGGAAITLLVEQYPLVKAVCWLAFVAVLSVVVAKAADDAE